MELPKLLSPSLHRLPEELLDRATRVRNRHVDFLVNPQAAQVLRLRSYIIQHLRNFLLNDQFIEVNTPILADNAGGAIARPFKTSATEFPDRSITLRIAPELWLKRLILGGIDRVFEIGPSFRNEGRFMPNL
jgi:lysyl-tRNA synthetase class 2